MSWTQIRNWLGRETKGQGHWRLEGAAENGVPGRQGGERGQEPGETGRCVAAQGGNQW